LRPVILLLLLMGVAATHGATLRVAVAANFKPTLQRINEGFEARSGHRILLSSASTGTLTNQISAGAPFDLFFAADRASVAHLAAAGHTAGAPGFCYAVGTLVLAGGDGRLAQLADPGLSLAVANPVVAPYGRAAQEVLARPEFARGESRKLVRGANVAQAYQYWYSGATDLALLPRSLAAGTEIPADWHAPVEQYAVRLDAGAGNPVLTEYLRWLVSEPAQTTIAAAGYRPCP
jgi:molybdate transport system substrate-binding protein